VVNRLATSSNVNLRMLNPKFRLKSKSVNRSIITKSVYNIIRFTDVAGKTSLMCTDVPILWHVAVAPLDQSCDFLHLDEENTLLSK
jgi:hypothetical protein